MTTRIRQRLVILCGLFLVLLFGCVSIQAASYDFTYEPVYPDTYYYKNGHQLEIQRVYISGKYAYKILVSTNNKGSKSTITGKYGAGFTVLAGKNDFIYLLKGQSYESKSEIRRYNWKTKKSTLIAKIRATDIELFNGKYLFYTLEQDGEFPLYRYSVSTGKTKKLFNDATIFKYGNGKYLVWREPGDFPNNVPIYVMNKNGGGIKRICKALNAVIYKNKIYYKKYVSYKNGVTDVIIYRCDLDGKNLKAMTKKINYNNIPEKYRNIGL